MRECDVWRNASDAEFDNAMEGMEKLVMNRLYDLYVLVLDSASHDSRHIQHLHTASCPRSATTSSHHG